jgi:hypothetical protein
MMVGLWMATLLGSCSEDLYGGDNLTGEKGYITLRFTMPQATVQETRATEEPGDNILNENTIKFVDLYFYPSGKSNEDAALVEENHAVQLDPNGGDTTYFVKVRTGDIILNKLFGSTQSGSCEVYAVANSSQESPSKSTCLDSLRLRVLRHNFGAHLTQGHFIMQSNPETLAKVELNDGAATGIIPMTRLATKLQIYLNVPDALHVYNEDGSNFAVWKSDRDHMSIMFNNGLMDYTLNGKDTSHPDSSFYNSMQVDMHKYATMTRNTVDYDYSHTPFYSYPFSWKETDTHVPTFIIAIPWSKRNPGTGSETYGTPEITYYQVHPNMLTGQLQSNYFYRMYMKIETVGSADNTTPVDITPSGYRIQPWGEVKVNTQKDVTGDLYRYTYLVVDPTSVVLNNTSSTTLRYSSSSALTKDTKITQVEYNSYETPGQVTHHTLTADDLAKLTTNRYELDYTSTPGQIRFTHNVDDGTYAAKTITIQVANDDGLTELVTIEQYPAIYMHTFDGDNAFVDGYFSHVADPASSIGDAISNRYSSGYYNSVNYSSYSYGNGYYYTYDRNSQNLTVPYGSMVKALSQTSGGIVNNSITEITVTSFNSNNGFYSANGETYYYQIGDPRESAGYSSSNLEPYLTSQESYSSWYYNYRLTLTSWGDNAAKIKKASNTKTVIAPQFFVSSGWNSSTSVSFTNAQKRAATYQEAGYSAGRWRLPTEAEIMFITARQKDGVIPVLFAMDNTSYYWAASGRLYRNGQFYDASANNNLGYMRFVYDTWYWGDKAGAVNYYHPEP